MAQTILDKDELSDYIQRHSQTRKPYISAYLIEYHFDTSASKARRVKELLEANLTEEQIKEAA